MDSQTPKAKTPKVRQTPIMLPPEMIIALDDMAQREGLLRGRSTLVRKAVREYLNRHGKRDQKQEVD